MVPTVDPGLVIMTWIKKQDGDIGINVKVALQELDLSADAEWTSFYSLMWLMDCLLKQCGWFCCCVLIYFGAVS